MSYDSPNAVSEEENSEEKPLVMHEILAIVASKPKILV